MANEHKDRLHLSSSSESPIAHSPPSSLASLALNALLITGIGLVVLCECFAMTKRYFVNDDYQIIYTTWLRSQALLPAIDFGIQSFHILPDLLRPLLVVVAFDPEKLWILRIPFLIVFASIPVLIWYISREWFAAPAALFAALASVLNWGMIERGLDLRPDLLITALLLLQMAIARRHGIRGPGATLVGLLFALMVTLRLKALIFFPLVIVWLLLERREKPNFRSALIPYALAGITLGTLLALAALTASDLLSAMTSGNRSMAHLATAGWQDWTTRIRTFHLLVDRDLTWLLMAALGFCIFLLSLAKTTKSLLLGTSLVSVVVYILVNSAQYAYSLVLIMPLLSLFVGLACASCLSSSRLQTLSRTALPLLVMCWLGSYAPFLTQFAFQHTNTEQLALAKALLQTPRDTHVFAMEGIGLFRPSLFDWRLSAISLEHYRSGRININAQLRDKLPEILIYNYRLPDWLTQGDQEWLSRHYLLVNPRIALLGKTLPANAANHIVLARPATFTVSHGHIEVDGVEHAAGERISLSQGSHRLRSGNTGGTIHFDWQTGADLKPSIEPYLISPDRSLYER